MDSEKLEELAKDFYPDEKWELMERIAFKRGYTECKERSYSEEDLREAFKQSRQCKIFEKDMPPVYNEFEDWFINFKKK